MSNPNNSSSSHNIPIPVNDRQSSSSSTTTATGVGLMEGLTVSDQQQQQPATVADTQPNDVHGNGGGGGALLGPTAIPSDEGEDSSRLLSSSFGVSGGSGLLRGLAETENTPRNVTTDYDDTFDGDDDDIEEGVIGEENNEQADDNDGNDDDESDYSYTYDDEDDGQFTGFLIPTEPFETTVAVAAATTTTAAATSFATTAASSGGAAVVVAEECAASNRGLPSSNSTTTANASTESWGKPLPPHTISRATSAMDSYINTTAVPETNPPDGSLERKQKWREPTRAAVNMSLRAEKEKTGGRRRLASDLYKIMTADTNEAGFSLSPSNDDSMDKWCIKLFGFDEDSNLAKDLLVCGVDHVELEMSFPDQYPFEPPFVRVVKPRFKKQTGFVMSGALCMELLTKDGWNPINDIESVIVSIRSLMVVGDGRLQSAVDMGKEEYEKVLKNLLDIRKSSHKQEELEEDAASDMDDDEEDCDTANAGGVDAKRKRAPSDDSKSGDSSSKSGSNKPSVAKKASSGGVYTVAEAKSAYDHLSKYHKQEGWDKNGWWSRKG